jgi:thioredoxin 1
MAGANTLSFTDDNFQNEVLDSDVPVLVDFWAEWCGPCKMLGPVIDELADGNVGKLKVGKVDIDANRDTSLKFQVSAIPTVMIFKQGEVLDKFVGLSSKDDLQAAIDKAIE